MLLVASDSDDCERKEPEHVKLPPDFSFLRKECLCKSRICFQQFRHQADQVQEKRNEFRNLPRHQKAKFAKHVDQNHMY